MNVGEHFKNTKYMINHLVVHKSVATDVPNFIYIKLPKTAGTSIYRGVIEPALYVQRDKMLDQWLREVTDNEIKDDYFKFTFIRNPFDRLVSAYVHFELKIPRDGETINNVGWLPSSPISFDNFIKNKIVDENGVPTNEHWSFQHDSVMTVDGEEFVNFVGKYENLDEDWKYVAKRLSLQEDLPHYKPGTYTNYKLSENRDLIGNRPLKEKDYRQYYSDELVEIVSNIYKKDLEVFGYEF